MGRRRKGTVEARANSIRINFAFAGKRCRETLDLAPTPQNLRAAERRLAEINKQIDLGIFMLSTPQEESEASGLRADMTVREWAGQWLPTLRKARATMLGYKSDLNNFWLPALGDKPMRRVLPLDIEKIIAEKLKTASPKRINNLLDPLRLMFKAAVDNRVIETSPAAAVSNEAFQRKKPDPFRREEMEAILGHMRERQPEVIFNYFTFAFATGMRPSELIALRWGDVDWAASQIKVCRARVRFEEKDTKTNKERDVDLNTRALGALIAQKKHTFLRGPDAPIFCTPEGKPWQSERLQRDDYFYPALKVVGVRKRQPRCTRHTCASLLLSSGLAVVWVANQLGHSVQTLLTNYAKWIPQGGQEIAKASDVFRAPGPHLIPDIAPVLPPQRSGD